MSTWRHPLSSDRRLRELTRTMKQRPVRAVLLGGPGAGKGTQSALIDEHYDIKHLSTGDLLRAEVTAGTSIGKAAAKLMSDGKLVDDETMIGIIKSQLQALGRDQGWVLDGFPRTLAQANSLSDLLEKDLKTPITALLNFEVDDETIVRRVTGRWVHKQSGRSYHETFKGMQPKIMNRDANGKVISAFDDETGDPLIRRSDDTEEACRQRLANYHQLSKPLLGYYKARGNFISLEAYDKFETWTYVQLALGSHDVKAAKECPTLASKEPGSPIRMTTSEKKSFIDKATDSGRVIR
eukprot:GHVH01002588.1.p1 GENE.GHVH01002588.1~~GHVH01002588.1.p1  ORF type:complete len:295 (-),score=49.07 GHVH01002588.1:43-927(-)